MQMHLDHLSCRCDADSESIVRVRLLPEPATEPEAPRFSSGERLHPVSHRAFQTWGIMIARPGRLRSRDFTAEGQAPGIPTAMLRKRTMTRFPRPLQVRRTALRDCKWNTGLTAPWRFRCRSAARKSRARNQPARTAPRVARGLDALPAAVEWGIGFRAHSFANARRPGYRKRRTQIAAPLLQFSYSASPCRVGGPVVSRTTTGPTGLAKDARPVHLSQRPRREDCLTEPPCRALLRRRRR